MNRTAIFLATGLIAAPVLARNIAILFISVLAPRLQAVERARVPHGTLSKMASPFAPASLPIFTRTALTVESFWITPWVGPPLVRAKEDGKRRAQGRKLRPFLGQEGCGALSR